MLEDIEHKTSLRKVTARTNKILALRKLIYPTNG